MKFTDLTLSEQLKISDRDIEGRKRLIDFNDEDAKMLKSIKPFIIENVDIIVEEFYSKQINIPEIQIVIGDAETFSRLHSSMKRYVIELFEGFYDKEYVNKRLRIGLVHKRIGVSPKLYISAIHILEGVLRKYLSKIPRNSNQSPDSMDYQESLRKVLTFDIQFVFDTYINSLLSEVKSAKDEMEEYANSLEEIVAQRTKELEELSSKDTLTGLYNQRFFYEQIRRDLSVSERSGQPISLVYIDLNNFKQLNDSKGHKAGGALLTIVGESLLSQVRDADMACRYGGDEFCIIMPNTTSDEAEEFCRRLTTNFDTREVQGISFSIGIFQLGPEKYSNMDSFVKSADKLMYKAKALSKEDPTHQICSGSN